MLNNHPRQIPFPAQLRNYLDRTGFSQREFAMMAGVDHSYLTLIFHNGKVPSRDIIISFAFALRLDLWEADDLLLLAGYPPLSRSSRREFRHDLVANTTFGGAA